MNEIMQNLFELQSLEFDETFRPETDQCIAGLRAKIPAPVLTHYDRLCARGKKGVAFLHHQTCGGCHMHVTLGKLLELKHGDEVRTCDNCGRYLYLAETVDEAPAPVTRRNIVKSGGRQLTHA